MSDHSRRAFLTSAVSVMASAGWSYRLHGASVPASGTQDEHLAPFDKLFTEFVPEHKLPGVGVAVTRHGKLVYARGFGFADVEKKQPVQPGSFFRIASVSKPITATGVMALAEQGKLKLDDPVLRHVTLKPAIPADGRFDRRWEKITVRQCLQHTGGWDRDKKGGFDPIGVPGLIKRALKLDGPPSPDDIVRYMMGQPLDFDPGARMVYSNLGYLVLGRVIESVTGQKYEPWVKKHVLGPAHVTDMYLGRALPEKRSRGEVRYYDSKGLVAPCLFPPRTGEQVPMPDGAENMDGFEAHGGWVASAVDLVRFACAFDNPQKSPVLTAESIKEMWARPEGAAGFTANKKPRDEYYACGWDVVLVEKGTRMNTWHAGALSGVSSTLVRRFDGLNWAVLFNTDADPKGKAPAVLIDEPMHRTADAIKTWPDVDLFEKFN
jgi:CubicO group peptidase (beta-lactamase class C family)